MGAAPVEDQPLKRTGERRSRLNFDLQFHHRVPLVRPDDLQLRGLGTSNEPRLEGRALNKLVSSQSAHFFLMRAQQLKRTTQPLPPVWVRREQLAERIQFRIRTAQAEEPVPFLCQVERVAPGFGPKLG